MTQKQPSLLADRVFRNLWATVELSFLGMFVHVVAAGWVMTELTSSATLVAMIQTAYALPIVFLSVLAGALADTFDRRRTMVASLLISLVASLTLALMSWLDALTPGLILALLFFVGTGVAIFTPSWQASLGDIAPRDRLIEAVSLHNMGANMMRTIGPSLGGLLTASVGATFSFLVGAFSYLPALISTSIMIRRSNLPPERERIGDAMHLAFRFLGVSPHVQTLLVRVFAFSLGAISVMALLPLIAKDQFGLGARAYGFLFGGYGLGAILGGLCLPRLRARLGVERTVRGAFLVSAIASGALALSTGFWTGLPATITAGSCWLIVHSLQNSVLQLSTPRWIVGRMVALFLSAAFLGLAIGGWLWGMVAESLGTEGALGLSAVALLATYGLAWRMPLPQITDPLPEPLAAEDQGDVAPLSGPLQIVIDHHIDEDRVTEFRAVMQLRRQHLTRLGAQHWMLMRDARDPTRWSESFESLGAADYRRIMGRRTTETAELRRRVTDLQKDGVGPTIRFLTRA